MSAHLVLISLALAPLASCAAAAVGAVGAAGVATIQDRTIGEAWDDATASNSIKALLLNKSAERFASVDVEVSGGLVLLSGRVNAPEDRIEAERIAWRQPQVQDVANEIRIAPPGGWQASLSDEVITARVRSRLIGSKSVKSVNFNVETFDGVVYLMGVARTPDELRKAAEEASVVHGVKQVVSYVELREKRPADIAAPAPVEYQDEAPATETEPSADPVIDEVSPLPELSEEADEAEDADAFDDLFGDDPSYQED